MTEKEFNRFLTLMVALLIACIVIAACVSFLVGVIGVLATCGYCIYVDIDCRIEIEKEHKARELAAKTGRRY